MSAPPRVPRAATVERRRVARVADDLGRLRAQTELERLARFAADVGEPLDQAADAGALDQGEFEARRAAQLAALAKLADDGGDS